MRIALALLVGLLLVPASAHAQPAIVRPPDEASLSDAELGRQLFAGNCATCHGDGGGVAGRGPSLLTAGRAAADFYLRTGYMPLGAPSEQPMRTRPRLQEREIRALVDYVGSLGDGPPVPAPRADSGDVAEGFTQFSEHCAGCHQIVGEGGVVTGARVPPLDHATAVQVAEAVRIGPYAMPAFSRRQISDSELDSIVAYVRYTQRPEDAGGWGINHLGPFPEGLVAWLIAGSLLVGTCLLIGERVRR
jgi:quinol---cytochrome-c reductase cytochrome c subunit